MCELVSLDSDNCIPSDGGIRLSYLAQCSDIASVTYTSGVITAFVMEELGGWIKYKYDTDDDTAYYNQTGVRTNRRHVFDQTAFIKFAGISDTTVEFANGIKDCCCLVAVHFLNDGATLVQGIEEDEDATAGFREVKKPAKATVNVMTGTGAEEARVEVSIISQARSASATTDLTPEDLEAL